MSIRGKVVLKKGKEHSVERFHPWIFSGAINKTDGDLEDGCWVEVLDFKNKTLGFGHYQNGSIAIRILSFDKAAPGAGFWIQNFTTPSKYGRAQGSRRRKPRPSG